MGADREAQKGQPRSAKTKPSRAEDSPHGSTQAPLPPRRPLLAPARSEAVWALAAANNQAAHHGVQGRNEGRGAAALGGVRLHLAWDGGASGGWLLVVSVGTTAWGQPSRRLFVAIEREYHGACRENRPRGFRENRPQ